MIRILCKAAGVVAGLIVDIVITAAIPGSSIAEFILAALAAIITGIVSYKGACSTMSKYSGSVVYA